LKSKYIYYVIAALLIAVVAYPIVYASVSNYNVVTNPFFCAPLIPCEKQAPGVEICIPSCTVLMIDSSFSPGMVNVTQGSTITWVNKDAFSHSATAFNTSAFNTFLIAPGRAYSFTVPKTLSPGSYYYYCSVHPFMIGLVNVLPNGSS
jgi:Copper binding proteins, plastocyanin/azurin family